MKAVYRRNSNPSKCNMACIYSKFQSLEKQKIAFTYGRITASNGMLGRLVCIFGQPASSKNRAAPWPMKIVKQNVINRNAHSIKPRRLMRRREKFNSSGPICIKPDQMLVMPNQLIRPAPARRQNIKQVHEANVLFIKSGYALKKVDAFMATSASFSFTILCLARESRCRSLRFARAKVSDSVIIIIEAFHRREFWPHYRIWRRRELVGIFQVFGGNRGGVGGMCSLK